MVTTLNVVSKDIKSYQVKAHYKTLPWHPHNNIGNVRCLLRHITLCLYDNYCL